MKSLVMKDVFFDALEADSELANDFEDKFLGDAFANASDAVLKNNAEEAFTGVSHNEFISLGFRV
jgi:hypothetical protein